MATTAMKDCKDAASLCSMLCIDPFVYTGFPEIRCVSEIALTIPLSTARGHELVFHSSRGPRCVREWQKS